MARHFIGIRTEELSKLFPCESHFKSARASSIFVIVVVVVVQIYSYYVRLSGRWVRDISSCRHCIARNEPFISSNFAFDGIIF